MNKLILTLGAAAILFSACGKPSGTYGETPQAGEPTAISALLKDTDQYAGQTVKVSGTITSECPHGGWFYLKDNTGEIYVNLHPSNFAIPQAVGQTVVAEGKLKKEGVTVEVVGTGVDIP